MSETRRTILEQRWEAELAAEQESQARQERPDQADGSTKGEPVAAAETSEQQDLAALQREVETLRDRVLRTQAELVNFRRRTARDREDQAVQARADVLRELLPIVDDFDRAVSADADNPDAYRQGVDMILRSLHDLLTRFGVERIEPLGERFDPHLHEAVEQVVDAEVEGGRIVAVYQPGYRLGDRLLRAARVVVSAEPAEPASDAGNDSSAADSSDGDAASDARPHASD